MRKISLRFQHFPASWREYDSQAARKGDTMKKILATVLALTIAAPAVAGGLAPVVVEPEVVVEETASTSSGAIVPLLLLLLVAAAVASSD
jgi:hypothetical protein